MSLTRRRELALYEANLTRCCTRPDEWLTDTK